MTFRLPPLNSLRIFEAAGRLSNFRLASEELSLTPSAVSHGIRGLEEWLGTPLFVRSKKRVRITAAGEAFLPRVSGALNRLAVAVEQTRSTRSTGRLSISVPPTFAARWLMPRLPRFLGQYPEIVVTISTERRPLDMPADPPDVAIRMALRPKQRGTWIHLIQESYIPVCAPTLIAQLPDGPVEARLAGAPLLRVTAMTDDWETWFAIRGITPPAAPQVLKFDTIQMALEAASEGLGIALGRTPVVDDDLRTGRLVGLDSEQVRGRTAYWLVGSDNAFEKSEASRFRTWLMSELGPQAAERSAGTTPR